MAIGSGILAAGAVGKAPPAVSLLREEYSLGLVYAGWILSVLSALGMVAGTGFGTLADRLGPRTVLLGGLWIQAIAGTLAVLSESASILLITRLLEGAGFLAVAVSAPGIIFAASSSGVRVWSLGLWSINVPVGISLAMIFAALTLETIGWRGVWLFYVVLISALAILGHQILPRERGFASREPSTTSPMPVLRRLGPWLLAGSFIAYTMMWISIMAWLPTYLINHQGLVSGTASLLSAAVVAANVPGNLLGTWLLRRQWSGGTIVALSSIGMGLSTYIVFSGQFGDVLRYGFCMVFSFVGGL
ncbi:MAG: MFS transporter, partial [Acidiferrobacteraceae bacterium]|nr:MFS transporter [Acidiferrobacteraceae bacterium]